MPESGLTQAIVVNWSLAELGLNANFTIDDSTTVGAQVAIFWPRAEAICIGLHDWTWFRRTNKLTRLSAAPDTGYRYAFALPGDRIGEPQKCLSDPRSRTPLRDFRIEGDALSCDEDTVYTVCKVRRPAKDWDIQFANGFAIVLASLLAVPLLQDVDMASEKMAQALGTPREGGAGGTFGRLIAQNRAAHPIGESHLDQDPLTMAHGPWHGRW